MLIWRRLRNLVRGTLQGWIVRRERRNPEAVYESAIQQRLAGYAELRAAAAGVLYARSKAERSAQRLSAELRRVQVQLDLAVDRDDDDAALVLIGRRDRLREELERVTAESRDLGSEAETAKKNLARFHEQIAELRDEKTHAAARLANAKARLRLHEVVSGFSPDDASLQALEAVRAHVHQVAAEADLMRELRPGKETDDTTASEARAELAALKRHRKGLLPVALAVAAR